MRLKNNESGNTLLMVIFLVTVITILGITLFTMSISATKQFTNKEAQVQARHLAEMGVLHYQVEVHEAVEGVESSGHQTDYLKMICEAVNGIAKATSPIKSDGTETGEYMVSPLTEIDCDLLDIDTENITVTVESIGTATGISKTIEAVITISGEGGGSEGDVGENPSKPELPEEDLELIETTKFPTGDFETSNPYKIFGTTMSNQVNWEFKNSLDVTGSITIDNDWGAASTIKIYKDLNAFDSVAIGNGYNDWNDTLFSRTRFVVVGNMNLVGNLTIHYNKYPVVVCGDLTVKGPIANPHQLLHVKGKVNGAESHQYKITSPNDMEAYISSACETSPEVDPTPSYNWGVEQQVKPEYK